ncbi:TetR/AcrR family transcriptional regulator [Microbulbifer sediminum]|uniref:TetR/AcrR family transcriptional regulator n=1 Tax=Microbulbifer sediminum TaxID=2904250 RepID=UPI001F1EF3C0|nr:TetR/AcrR family transcriptional regulator [Microbulbifer sediminum]
MKLPVGRPQGGSDARSRLIGAALDLFSHRSYRTVSTREIARSAGVDASLIRYYFGSKSGLFEQMLRETLAPLLDQLRDLDDDASPEDLGELMRLYYRAMGPNPGLPRLVVRVLLEEEGSEAYRIVLSIFSEIIQQSRHWFAKAVAGSGQLREHLDPDLCRLSIVSLVVFPLIAPPVLMQKFGLEPGPGKLAQLAQHNYEVIQSGILLPQGERD